MSKKGANNSARVSGVQKTAFSGSKRVFREIGVTNAERWKKLKEALECNSDEQFASVLLDLAQKHAKSKTVDVENGQKETAVETKLENEAEKKNAIVKKKKDTNGKQQKQRQKKTKEKESSSSSSLINTFAGKLTTTNDVASTAKTTTAAAQEQQTVDSPQKENLVVEKIVNTKNEEKNDSLINTSITSNSNININKNSNNVNPVPINNPVQKLECNEEPLAKRMKEQTQIKKEKPKKNNNNNTNTSNNNGKRLSHDIRRAPELKVQVKNEFPLGGIETDINNKTKNKNNVIQMCSSCGKMHLQGACLVSQVQVKDAMTKEEWKNKFHTSSDNESYAEMSCPKMLKLVESQSPHGFTLIANEPIKECTQFGPLIGKRIKEVDISEDSTFHDIWEIFLEKNIYLSTENPNESNYLKFIQPAQNREERNVSAVSSKDNQLIFIATKNINTGEELLYWQDDNFNLSKKKMVKTNCGGCNMNFSHPLYYRTHCSVFHDVRYSLTIRKFHCKVCGAAVLGKENIMKHAAENHNGQGAYQCQFCKKFFLRLNYLEMHRTYGCSANPHRSRPLCDFCGRKFCQPQKLKVHIKRMHSDMAVVLKEFQCKNCLKILGSRAALQRHVKEVHQKQVDGACACSRCGKLFQNRSNLKIHMLTHSGIKPFKCAESNCVAAFTTKQCLQFHYKKVHGFTEDMMPKITRSVDYTFEAYSGQEDQENGENKEGEDRGNENEENDNIQKHSDEGSISESEENSMEERNIDDPQPIKSPPINEQSISNESASSSLEPYTMPNMKVLSKGSKKWIGDDVEQLQHQFDHKIIDESSNITLEVDDGEPYNPPQSHSQSQNQNQTFNRHESANASLLVEAALDSVCSEPNIDIDVNNSQNCESTTEALVNNLYSHLTHSADTLPDVNCNVNCNYNDSRDINLISPSVNDHISVTDDLNDELRHQTSNIGLDYSFHQEDFSPAGSPIHSSNNNNNNRSSNFVVRDYITTENHVNSSPGASPPRYDFGQHAVNTNEHISSSEDSNGIGAQNLSIHNIQKINQSNQLDLSLYKQNTQTTYINNLDPSFSLRNRLIKFTDSNQTIKQDSYNNHGMDGGGDSGETTTTVSVEITDKDFEGIDEVKHQASSSSNQEKELSLKNKFSDLDLDLRMKNYEDIENLDLRTRVAYDSSSLQDQEFRMKNYDLDGLGGENRASIDVRNKLYDGLIENDFRQEQATRNFVEPLMLSSDLQGLDMSARSYHNYPNLNRYHHLYSTEVDRPSVDLRLNYSPPPPPPPSYTHADILRVVSLDLTPPGRHSVDLSLRSHQLSHSSHRLSLDQTRLDLSSTRHVLGMSDMSNRILSDHTTNRILSNDQRILGEDRLLDQSRLLQEARILAPPPSATGNGNLSPVAYTPYSVSPSPYHPTALQPPRPHATSPTPGPYHHYTAYY